MLIQIVTATGLFVAGLGARWLWELRRDTRAYRAHQSVETEAARILPGLRERVAQTWEQTSPRGPEAVARALYTTYVYQARHRAPLEDSETYQRRTLSPAWRAGAAPIPRLEVFRT